MLIPPVVREELQVDSELPGTPEVRAALQAGWLREAVPSNTALVQTLSLELDQGEAAAIALALEVKPAFMEYEKTLSRYRAALPA